MLQNETIFITGATSGFGLATAHLCAQHGAKLILAGRRKDRLEKLQKELSTPTHITPFDITDQVALQHAVKTLPPEFQSVTALINNAGLSLGLEPAQERNLADWETMVDTNIKGLMRLTHALLPGMVKRNRGYIINIGSIAGSYAYLGGNVYGATKAFVHHFSLGLRADLLGTNVRVTSIEPGLAATEFSLVRFQGDSKKATEIYKGTEPLVAEDIAQAIFFCLTRPQHVNINHMEIMPTCQAPAGTNIYRK